MLYRAEVNRDAVRLHALDGAVLLFQPSTGQSIRIETERTAHLRRRAPRVVLFSLSHACNLRCGFCSRDAAQRAQWRNDDAAAVLELLHEAGTLEVSFGGGEPLAHRGFVDLLERLHASTSLALHLTTNGTLVTPDLARRLAAVVGEVRLSAYRDQDWRSALQTLVAAGCRVGVNVMAQPSHLAELPSLFERARETGACDVAILRYVGSDRALHCDPTELAWLEQAIMAAPLPVRVSNCLLDALPNVPRIFAGATVATHDGLRADCGAGRDFVVIDPDAQVRSCSFHADAVRLADVGEWLEHYRRVGKSVAAPRMGCARPVHSAPKLAAGAYAYRSFASNNSGDTLMVARFDRPIEAEAFCETLPCGPAFEEIGDDAWTRFYEAQGVRQCDGDDYTGLDPEPTIARVGRTLLATATDSDDALYELRALLYRARAVTVYTAVHSHDAPALVVGVRDDRDGPAHQALDELGFRPQRRGPTVLGLSDVKRHAWHEVLPVLGQRLGARAWSAELIAGPHDGAWADTLKHLDEQRWSPRGYFCLNFVDQQRAAAFASALDAPGHSRLGRTILCDVERLRPRLGQRAHEHGGTAWWMPREDMSLRAWFYGTQSKTPDIAATRALLGEGFECSTAYHSISICTTTDDPHTMMRVMQQAFERLRAEHPDLRGGAWLGPARLLEHAARRVRDELAVL